MGAEQPKVSIVITNYNYARFLPAAIESALEQRGITVEVIVVDDGSTDESRSIIAAYEQSGKVRAIFQSNSGQAHAFFTGLQQSRGTYVLFLDADDVLFPNAVATAAAAMKDNVVKVQFPLEQIDEMGNRLGSIVPRYIPEPLHAKELLLVAGGYPSPPTSGNLWARWFLEAVLPVPLSIGHLAADGYLIWLAPFFGSVVHLPQVLGFYRIHSENRFAQADSLTNPEKISRGLAADLKRMEAVQRTLRKHGLHVPIHELFAKNVDHLRRRVLLSRLDSQRYRQLPFPVPGFWDFFRAVWKSQEIAPREKFALLLTVGAVTLSPSPLRSKIANLLFNPNQRPAFFQRVVDYLKQADRERAREKGH